MLVTLIDDDEAVLESLPDLVREFGYRVAAFSSAGDFLASVVVDQTCCLILDFAMPDMSGLELMQELRRRGKDIPVVFITGNKDEGVRTRLIMQGARECLFKPFSDSALFAALKAALGEV
jgi:FixJ family two-component response regulator